MSDPRAAPQADLERLRALLARFEQIWVERDALTLRYLRPGLTDTQIDAATGSLGVLLPVEAREWFHWHDGVNRRPGDAVSARAACAGPPMELRTLEECVQATQSNRHGAQSGIEVGIDPDYAWPAGWFVLAEAGHGGPMIIDTAVPPGVVAPIHVTDWAEIERQRRARVGSLTEVVATWVELIEDGVYTYDAALGYWLVDHSRLSLEQRRAEVY